MEQRLFCIWRGHGVACSASAASRKEFTAIGAPFNHARYLLENALAGEISSAAPTPCRDVVTVDGWPRADHAAPIYTEIYRVTGIRAAIP